MWFRVTYLKRPFFDPRSEKTDRLDVIRGTCRAYETCATLHDFAGNIVGCVFENGTARKVTGEPWEELDRDFRRHVEPPVVTQFECVAPAGKHRVTAQVVTDRSAILRAA